MVRTLARGPVLAGILLVALLFLSVTGQPLSPGVTASEPGTTIAPLLSCPNLDGSADHGVRVADILAVVGAYFTDWPSQDYVFMYDVHNPYNPETDDGGLLRMDDILAVVGRYFETCPVVDTEVALATQWGLANVPMTEDAAALQKIGYYRGSTDVPGQGAHYVNLDNWDGVFDPAAPEGLVYQNGRLAAQLYVTNGDVVGWGAHAAESWPPPPVPHSVDLEADPDGPQCDPKCSWDGTYDGWHLHYYLCTIGIGTPAAAAIPGVFINIQNQEGCAWLSGGQPECTIPITETPCYRFAQNVGWMGHLWNWLPNANQIPDEGGINGRFADCFPDREGWKEFNCPA